MKRFCDYSRSFHNDMCPFCLAPCISPAPQQVCHRICCTWWSTEITGNSSSFYGCNWCIHVLVLPVLQPRCHGKSKFSAFRVWEWNWVGRHSSSFTEWLLDKKEMSSWSKFYFVFIFLKSYPFILESICEGEEGQR